MFYIFLGNDLLYEPSIDELAVFNPRVTLEMGKAGSLEFDIPQSNPYYSSINQLTSQVRVMMDDDEIFRGRVLSNERAFNNVRTVYCEGDLAYLVDSVQKTEKYNGKTRALFNKFIANHNARVEASKQFTVGDVTIEDRDIVLTGQSDDINVGNIDYKQIAINSIVDEWNTTFDEIQTCLIDYVGGYLRTRYQNGVNYIDFVQEYGGESSQEIELGENLLDLTEEISAEDLFTVLVPLGDDNLTIASVNGGSDELVDTEAVAKYGRIVKTHVFNNVNSASTLLENARRFLASNVNVPRTVTITAVDLHLLNQAIVPIRLGDRVHISSLPHSMDEYLTCTKIEYDLANPANNKYTFGNPKQSLTERYKEDKRKENDTYGNSASGGHGGGGGAAADAAEAVAEETVEETNKDTERQIGKFYDSYIDLDPEDDGKIKLGSFFKEWTGAKEILINDVGIELDVPTGNINIKTLSNMVDSNAENIGHQSARIDLLQEETGVSIQQLTEYVNNKHEEYRTELIQRSNANEASITAEVRRATGAEASLQIAVDKNGSRISANADLIELKADQINLDAALTRITNLEADVADVNKLRARLSSMGYASIGQLDVNNLDADSISIGEVPVYTRDHYHSLSASGGVVRMGTATYSSSNASFNIADTQFYKDGVSAAKTAGAESATLRSLSVGDAGSPYSYNGGIYADVSISATVAATKGDGSLYTDSTSLTKAVKLPFKTVTVNLLKTPGKTRYKSAGSVTVTLQGSQYEYTAFRQVGTNKYAQITIPLYRGGSSATYYLRGSDETVYDSAGQATYYTTI